MIWAMKMCPIKLFQFLRGGLRGAYGTEDLTLRQFLVIGMAVSGQQLLSRICIPQVRVSFYDTNLLNYTQGFGVCSSVGFCKEASSDVIIDFNTDTLTIQGKSFSFQHIGENAYEQGIHEFYL